jgi:hypothetical protein
MRLLNACLDPDALLNAGKLREFFTALQLIVQLSVSGTTRTGGTVGGTSSQPSIILSSFDAQRFAVLVAEKPGAVRASAAGAGGSGSGSSSGSAFSSSSRNRVSLIF